MSGRLAFASIFAFYTFPNTTPTQAHAVQAVVSLVRYVETFFAMLNPCFLGKKAFRGKNRAEGGPIGPAKSCECWPMTAKHASCASHS
jgi:hypothetical protein